MTAGNSLSVQLNKRINDSLDQHLPAAVELRRRLHATPEIGFDETQTAAIVAAHLAPMALETKHGVGGEGIVALLRGQSPDPAPPAWPHRPVIALRADLDALRVTEETGLPYASTIPGMMHACGHDMHMAAAALAGAVLQDLRDELAGDVKLLFQPAEESGGRPAAGIDPFVTFRRGPGGAQQMIAAGALEDPAVDAIVGLHCWPDLPVGVVGVDPRVAMAGNGVLRVRVRGKGGHGATPHQTLDPVPAAATMILALQTMVSRYNDPANPLVLSITTLQAGAAVNVIPEKVEFQATLRSVKPGFIEGELGELATRMVQGIAAGYGLEVDVTCGAGLPVTVNDGRMVDSALASAASILGPANAKLLDALAMTSEDFAYYAHLVPAVYIKVGVAGPDGCAPLHNPRFSPDEGALAVGAKAMARLALDLCRTGLPAAGSC